MQYIYETFRELFSRYSVIKWSTLIYPLYTLQIAFIAYHSIKKVFDERQMPYDLTYKWSLINKANKRAIKNKLTVTRTGGRREITGIEGQGTCIKDPWTKTTGGERTECGRWEWVGQRRVGGGKWWRLLLNNNIKRFWISFYVQMQWIILHPHLQFSIAWDIICSPIIWHHILPHLLSLAVSFYSHENSCVCFLHQTIRGLMTPLEVCESRLWFLWID